MSSIKHLKAWRACFKKNIEGRSASRPSFTISLPYSEHYFDKTQRTTMSRPTFFLYFISKKAPQVLCLQHPVKPNSRNRKPEVIGTTVDYAAAEV